MPNSLSAHHARVRKQHEPAKRSQPLRGYHNIRARIMTLRRVLVKRTPPDRHGVIAALLKKERVMQLSELVCQ